MQASSDIFLGWQRTEAGLDGQARDFYVRQLRDWKFSLDIPAMRPPGMRGYGELCGWTLARAHARSGDRIAIASYLGGSDVFDKAIAQFAVAYADQNERDRQALQHAAATGRSPPSTADDHGPGRAHGRARVARARLGSAVSAPALVWQDRADEPQDRQEEPDQAENPVTLPERDHGQGK
jgi:Uncharacterized protein conserved in bacteria (DUF2252)